MNATLRVCCAGFLSFTVCQAVFAQAPKFARVGTIDGPAELVQLRGTSAYVVADKTLRIFDVASPSAPRRVGAYTFPEHIRALTVSGALVYAAADFYGLRIVDVSNPEVPVERGSLPMRGGILTIAMAGRNVLVTTNLVEGVQIVDVSNARAPVLLTTYFTDGYAQAVAASGPLAYVSDSPTGLYILDLSNASSPAVMSTLQTTIKRLGSGEMPAVPSPLVAVSEQAAASAARTAVVLEKMTGLVELFDVTNPRKAPKIGEVGTSARSQCLAVSGFWAYIGVQDGVQILDLSDRSKPALAASFKTRQPPLSVAVADSLVFAAVGPGGVEVFRQSF